MKNYIEHDDGLFFTGRPSKNGLRIDAEVVDPGDNRLYIAVQGCVIVGRYFVDNYSRSSTQALCGNWGEIYGASFPGNLREWKKSLTSL